MEDFPRRYDIHFADLNPTVGAEIRKVRPVVVVSRNDMNRYLGTVVVCPLTTSLHPGWRSRIQVQCAGRHAEIAVDQIRTISKKRLKEGVD
ncbi:MAG: type II toxin-antitoxin system PemK/MazF family toxin, partial [Gemmatimonadetes bacterium]|nr:type II toxin-antitoxin system PemK/MazF family toxin [Gemmatimonadota bacterium]